MTMDQNYFYALSGPLDTLPGELQVRAANLGGFSDLVRNLGGDPRRMLERHGMDPRAVLDPDYFIACKSLVDLFEHCSSSFDDALFGLRLGRLQEPDVFGCVTALCRAAGSFREAIESLMNYMPVVHSPESMLELAEGKETVELRWFVRTDLGLNSQANYQAAVLNMKLLRQVGGPAFRPSYVNFAFDVRPKDIPQIEESLGCKVHGGAPMNAIAFPAGCMDRPVTTSNRLLHRLVGGYLDRVRAASRKTIAERVEDYVRGALPSGNCSIERCAKKLGTSVRTLQSELSQCRLKFSDIVERQRIALATSYLEQRQLSLDEVAVLLGYSEQTSFGRAFKRWTGSTPQRYRAVRGLPRVRSNKSRTAHLSLPA
jgi:AraC-like DNA-binding protein